MKRVRNNKVDSIWILMFGHQKVSIDANKVLPQWSLLCFFNYLSPVSFANQMNEALFLICSQKICSQLSQLDLFVLAIAYNYQSLKIFGNFNKNFLFSQSSHCNVHQLFIPIFVNNVDHFVSYF